MRSDLDLPSAEKFGTVKRRRDNKRRKKQVNGLRLQTKQRKDRGDEPRFIPTKKRAKFNKQQIMRML